MDVTRNKKRTMGEFPDDICYNDSNSMQPVGLGGGITTVSANFTGTKENWSK